MNNRSYNPHLRALLCVALTVAAGAVAGCRGDREDKPPRQFFPDLDDQPKWKPQAGSGFFTDGRTLREPPSGTVPFGRVPFEPTDDELAFLAQERADMFKGDVTVYEGVTAEGDYVANIPAAVKVDRALLMLGMEKYNIYCVACHGYEGDGKGMVAPYWSAGVVPSYHDDKYRDRTQETGKDGYMFHVIRNGIRNMPGYKHSINEREAWAIVAYLRALQATREGALTDVPEAQRSELERRRPRPANPEPAPAAGGQQ